MKIFLLFLLTVAARGISKREDEPSCFFGFCSTLFNFKYDDFINLDNAETQLIYLIATAQLNPRIAEYIFTRLDPVQRLRILEESTRVDRFQLFDSFHINGQAILLRLMDDAEVEMILESKKTPEVARIMEKYDDNGVIDIFQRMGTKSRVNWILSLDKVKIEALRDSLMWNWPLMKNLAQDMFQVRLQAMHLNQLKELKGITPLLNELADYYSRQDLNALKESTNPIYILSRFTPAERDKFRRLMTIDEKKELLEMKLKNTRQRFPGDFFGSSVKSNDLGSISNQEEWAKFWHRIVYDIKNTNIDVKQRQIFGHRPVAAKTLKSFRLTD